jgi:hypothetical protein
LVADCAKLGFEPVGSTSRRQRGNTGGSVVFILSFDAPEKFSQPAKTVFRNHEMTAGGEFRRPKPVHPKTSDARKIN